MNQLGSKFDDFLKEENLINIIAKWENQKEFDINAGIDYYKFLEKYKKESEDEK